MTDYEFGTKEYFDRLYLSSEEPWGISFRASQQCRYSSYIRLLKQFSNKYESVLDIGCSQGQFTIMLRDIASQIIGIDISKTAIERAKERYRDCKKIKFDYPKTFPSQSCNRIISYYSQTPLPKIYSIPNRTFRLKGANHSSSDSHRFQSSRLNDTLHHSIEGF